MVNVQLKSMSSFYFLFLLVVVTNNLLIKSLTTSSLLSCCVTCIHTTHCRGVSFEERSNVCGIRSSVEEQADWVIIPDTESTTGSTTGYHVINLPESDQCDEYLVSGFHGVKDEQLTASSAHGVGGHEPIRARLFNEEVHWNNAPTLSAAWVPSSPFYDQYIQVRFNNVSLVRGIATQGRHVDTVTGCCAQHVTRYRVLYSLDCTGFQYVKDMGGNDVIFPGNSDQDSVVTNLLDPAVIARCLRINPVTWVVLPALRFDVTGCALSRSPWN